MHARLLGSWIATFTVAMSTLVTIHPAAASPRMISVAAGPEEFRQKLAAAPGKPFIIDARSGNALGGENIVLSATRSGALDVAVLTGGVVSAGVPELSVFDVP